MSAGSCHRPTGLFTSPSFVPDPTFSAFASNFSITFFRVLTMMPFLAQLLLAAIALFHPTVAQDCGGMRQMPCVDADGNPFCTFEPAGLNGRGVCVTCGNNGRPVCLSAPLSCVTPCSLEKSFLRCRLLLSLQKLTWSKLCTRCRHRVPNLLELNQA